MNSLRILKCMHIGCLAMIPSSVKIKLVAVKDNPQLLIIVLLPNFTEDDKNNQFFQTDGTSQKLSRDEIMNLKAQGVSGKVRE